jgi:hypothetical protein
MGNPTYYMVNCGPVALVPVLVSPRDLLEAVEDPRVPLEGRRVSLVHCLGDPPPAVLGQVWVSSRDYPEAGEEHLGWQGVYMENLTYYTAD